MGGSFLPAALPFEALEAGLEGGCVVGIESVPEPPTFQAPVTEPPRIRNRISQSKSPRTGNYGKH